MSRQLSHVALAAALWVGLGSAGPLEAHHRPSPSRRELHGGHVSASVEIRGRRASLYAAPDGSGRYYFEAAEGASYVVRLRNRGRERLGVRLSVDGLNVIDGVAVAADGDPGRMYILAPRGEAVIRGWRTSLREVRRFTFVDEDVSYAARTGQTTGKLGWIEIDVFRERPRLELAGPYVGEQRARPEGDAAEAAPSRTPQSPSGAEAKRAARDSFPGTGWGDRAHDRVRLVSFDPDPSPIQRSVLRYEYRSGLVALGIRLGPDPNPSRLAQRDRGEAGFALPPPH